MDEEQDFAYAVSEKALRHIAETAGREVPGVVAIRGRSVSVAGGIVRVHLAVRARYGGDLHHLALAVQQRAAAVIEERWLNRRDSIFPSPLKTWPFRQLNKL